jgi:hypothetical protein
MTVLRLRILQAISVVLVCVLGLSACGGTDTGTVVQPHAGIDGLPAKSGQGKSTSHPSGYFGYQPPILPIVFAVSADGQFSINVSSKFATPFGTIHFGGNIAMSPPGAAVRRDTTDHMSQRQCSSEL